MDDDNAGPWVYYKLTYEPLAQVSSKYDWPKSLCYILGFKVVGRLFWIHFGEEIFLRFFTICVAAILVKGPRHLKL